MEDLKERVEKCLGPKGLLIAMTECQGDLSVEVPKRRILDVMHLLKDTPDLEFDFLSDVFGVDNSAFYEKQKSKKKPEGEKEVPSPPRFEVIYLLLCLKRTERLQVKIRVAEDDMEVDSVTSIWKAANWPEREAFDMFGIRFKGHPNLKRLLMWDEFPAYPLRKDYPLEGRGEERPLAYGE
jgi:NADH-quinone oxidoreductase subunit C